MSTQHDTDLDLTVLEFEPNCTVAGCDATAIWVVRRKVPQHCAGFEIRLWCDAHWASPLLDEPIAWKCNHCGTRLGVVVYRIEYGLSAEPLHGTP